jgi:DNA invertase Pin-like site-specific DNA recombinase
MPKEWFYMRLSTQTKGEQGIKQREQSFERQIGIFERAGFVLTEENTFAERVSGKTKNDEREQFEKLLSVVQEGDWVNISESSRFSRSYIYAMEMIDTLIFEKKVNMRFISNGIELLANSRFNPYIWYSLSQTFLSDELYRRTVSYNTAQGLKRIKEKGEKTLGRPTIHTDEQRSEVRRMYGEGKRVSQIAEATGLPRSTINRMIEDLK